MDVSGISIEVADSISISNIVGLESYKNWGIDASLPLTAAYGDQYARIRLPFERLSDFESRSTDVSTIRLPNGAEGVDISIANYFFDVTEYQALMQAHNPKYSYKSVLTVSVGLADGSTLALDDIILCSAQDAILTVMDEWLELNNYLNSGLTAHNDSLADVRSISFGMRDTQSSKFFQFEVAPRFVMDIRTVPEPGTYAMLAGLSVVGFAMVRRRRTTGRVS